jgi:two-component system nitrate/nitrite response regulator NarL
MGTGILLVDDHALFREGLQMLIGHDPELRVVAQAGTAAAARGLATTVAHNLLVIDIGLPDESGFDLLRSLRAAGNTAPALMLTMFAMPDYVLEAFSAGAQGYALKHQSPAEILEALRTVAAGRRYLSPLVEPPPPGEAQRGVLATLSARERDVFNAIVGGLTNSECATRLGISVKTVETHRGHLFRKLSVHSLAELVQLAGRHHALGDPPADVVPLLKRC